jgi:hypothetical protein
MGLGRVQLRKISPYIIGSQGFTAKQPEPHPCQLVRKIGMLRRTGAEKEMKQRVKTEALSRVEAAEGIDAA